MKINIVINGFVFSLFTNFQINNFMVWWLIALA